jgi:hypothetical protein
MRKFRMMDHISLDGFIAPPGDDNYANDGWMAAHRSSAWRSRRQQRNFGA